MQEPCPKCGRAQSFDKEQGVYRCIPCAFGNTGLLQITETDPNPEGAVSSTPDSSEDRPLGEVPLEQLEKEFQTRKYLGRKVILANCSGCGAQTEATAADFVSECLYCGHKTTISESTQLSSQYKAVVPFKVTPDAAVEAVKRFLRAAKFGSMVSPSHVQAKDVKKLYVPFWCYDVEVTTTFEGNTQKRLAPNLFQSLTGGSGSVQPVNVSGERSEFYNDKLVCGSSSVPFELLRSLEPFSTEGAEWGGDLDDPSLIIERVQNSPREAWSKVRTAVQANEYDAIVGISDNAALLHKCDLPRISGSVHFKKISGKAALLPVYIFYKDTPKGPCRVVVNGETGSVAGKVPERFDPKMVSLVLGFIISMTDNRYLKAIFDRYFGKEALAEDRLEFEEMQREKAKMLHSTGG